MKGDGWKPLSPLGIREDSTFTQQVADLGLDVKRLDEQLHGLTWAIATHPHQFNRVIGSVFVAVTNEYPDAPRLRVIFSIEYEEGYGTLRWIELVPDIPT